MVTTFEPEMKLGIRISPCCRAGPGILKMPKLLVASLESQMPHVRPFSCGLLKLLSKFQRPTRMVPSDYRFHINKWRVKRGAKFDDIQLAIITRKKLNKE